MLDPKPVYCIEGNKVYRKLEAVPVFEIKGNKIYLSLNSKVLYEIKGVYKGSFCYVRERKTSKYTVASDV